MDPSSQHIIVALTVEQTFTQFLQGVRHCSESMVIQGWLKHGPCTQGACDPVGEMAICTAPLTEGKVWVLHYICSGLNTCGFSSCCSALGGKQEACRSRLDLLTEVPCAGRDVWISPHIGSCYLLSCYPFDLPLDFHYFLLEISQSFKLIAVNA